jgi:hypothetical protein
MDKTLATLPSDNILVPADPAEYWTESTDRRWELTLNWKTKVYLTDQEKEYFMAQLKAGKRIVRVGEMILTKKFDCLIPTRKPRAAVLTEAEKTAIMEKAKRSTKGLDKGLRQS